MANTHRFFLKSYSTILGILLTFLGFAVSCSGKMEYGSPSAKFIVKGKVESSGTNTPVKNIQVIMQGDSTLTDSTGHYQVVSRGFPQNLTFPIRFDDIDGTLQGEYTKLDTVVEFKDPEFTNGDGHWYKGEATKE